MDYQSPSAVSSSLSFQPTNEVEEYQETQEEEDYDSGEHPNKRVRVANTIVIKKCTNVDKSKNKKPKNSDIPPTIENESITKSYNYSVADLKKYLKQYGLPVSGTKQILHTRLFGWLTCVKKAVKIQSLYRGYLIRSVRKLFSKYKSMLEDCVNDQDFYSFEDLKDVDKYQIICLQDSDGHLYGFNISSIYQYKKKLDVGVELTNPYTRNKVSKEFIAELSKIVYSSKKSIIPTILDIDYEVDNLQLSYEKRVELRAVSLFQQINSLGNYSDVSWFMNLSRRRIIRMTQELFDIWNFRLNINSETKRAICPPFGDPFENNMTINIGLMTIDELRNVALHIFENFVFRGVDRDSQCLGSFYVLGALTLVSSVAAESSPWLFQSFVY